MQLLHDYILVKEIVNNQELGNSGLKMKYDDSERFMTVEILDVSPMLLDCYRRDFPSADDTALKLIVSSAYAKGNHLIINRVAKTPYKEGTYFISYKDVIGVDNGE